MQPDSPSLTACTELYGALRRLWRPPQAGADALACAGVLDPDSGLLPNQHYALSHLMLSAHLLHGLTRSEFYRDDRDAMLDALEAHHAAAYRAYPPDEIHWDFNNLALLQVAVTDPSGAVAARLRSGGFGGLRRENGTLAGNWLAMRAFADGLRATTGLPRRRLLRALEQRALRARLQPDGGFDEFPRRSRPIQYHAYMLALELRRHVLLGTAPDAPTASRLVAAAEYLLAHIDAGGRANYRGRGQYQLFFEAPARYALRTLAARAAPEQAQQLVDAADALDRQSWPRRADGLLALVSTDPAGERVGCQYDYHFASVYSAFHLAWSLLVLSDAQPAPARWELPAPARPRPLHFSRSNLFVLHRGGWTLAVSGGEPMYLSDVGVTPCHLGGERGVIFTAPGGPHPNRYGTRHGGDFLLENVFAPLAIDAAGRGVPHFTAGTLRTTGGEALDVRASAHGMSVERQLRMMPGALSFRDRLRCREGGRLRRIFQLPLPETHRVVPAEEGALAIEAQDGRHLATLRFADRSRPLPQSGPAFRGPGGRVRPLWLDARGPDDHIEFVLELAS